MEVPEVRTWVIFYLLSFVVLLVAVFITSRDDGQLWISLMLIIVVVGVNFSLLFSELKRYRERRAFIKRISQFGKSGTESDGSGHRW